MKASLRKLGKIVLGMVVLVTSPVWICGFILYGMGRAFHSVGDSVIADWRRTQRRRAAARARLAPKPKEYPPEATWDDMTRRIGDIPDDARATDYCKRCGESPESGTHIFNHPYEDPRK